MPEADRLRLAGRVPADYVGYGYAPIFADDMKAVAAVASDVAADALAADADAQQTAADRVATGLDRVAAAASAAAAAGMISAIADRTSGRRPNDISAWGFLRSTTAWGYPANGVLAETPIDTIRMEYDPTTLAPLGPAFAGARTNAVLNPWFVGGTVGVIGSGGVAPTNVTLPAAVAGITVEILNFSPLPDGRPAMEVRWSGTAGASGRAGVLMNTGAGVVFAASEVIACQIGYQMTAGSFANFGTPTRRTSGISPASTPSIAAPTSTLNMLTFTVTCTGNTTSGGAGLELLFGYFPGVPIDITLRFVMPQIQRSASLSAPFISAPVLPASNATGPSSRAQGTSTQPVSDLGTRWNYRQGLILLDWNSQPGAFTSALDADWMGLVSWGNSTANERMGLVINPAHTSIEARMTAGGVVQTASAVTITAPAAGATTRALLAWNLDAVSPGNGWMQVCARGLAGTKVAITTLPKPGFIMRGRFATSHPLYGRIPGFDVQPAALFDSAAAALTA